MRKMYCRPYHKFMIVAQCPPVGSIKGEPQHRVQLYLVDGETCRLTWGDPLHAPISQLSSPPHLAVDFLSDLPTFQLPTSSVYPSVSKYACDGKIWDFPPITRHITEMVGLRRCYRRQLGSRMCSGKRRRRSP